MKALRQDCLLQRWSPQSEAGFALRVACMEEGCGAYGLLCMRGFVSGTSARCARGQAWARCPTRQPPAQVTRTREVIESVEIEHAAPAGEAPVITVAEQRTTRRTTMERGAKRAPALPPSQPVEVRAPCGRGA